MPKCMPEERPFVYAFLMLLPSLCVPEAPCPAECACKWRGGKQTAACGGVAAIPGGLSAETQVLDLSGNLLQLLPSRGFSARRLLHLQRVYAARCGLRSVAEDAFHGLSNLVDLDLSSNFLSWVPVTALRETPLLRRLLLSGNPIQRLENDSFASLEHLTNLELAHCEIRAVEARAFRGLRRLEYLKLAGNRLAALPMPELAEPFGTLFALELDQNPWHCDCRARSLRLWMARHNVPLSAPPRCAAPPRLRGAQWDNVSLDEFACAPRVRAVEAEVRAAEGENATLGCRVRATPEAAVSWLWRGRPIANLTLMSFGRQMYLIREVGTTFKVNSLTIFNVMLKDSGEYLCVVANPAGRAAANVTLSVRPRGEAEQLLSGEELAGVVIGALFALFALFFVCSFFLLRHQSLFPKQARGKEAGWAGAVARETERGVELCALEPGGARTEYVRPPAAPPAEPPAAGPAEAKHSYFFEHELPLAWPLAEPPYQEESYHSYESPSQSSWKKNSLILPQHLFAPDARDSPDEGLGDETDILD